MQARLEHIHLPALPAPALQGFLAQLRKHQGKCRRDKLPLLSISRPSCLLLALALLQMLNYYVVLGEGEAESL